MTDRRPIQSVFPTPEAFTAALKGLREAGISDLEAFGPTNLEAAEPLLPRKGSPVRVATFVAGLAGCALGFWLCIGSALLYGKIVGGKPPVSLMPYCVVGFELTILAGGVITLAAVLGLGRLGPRPLARDYLPSYSADKFGITVHTAPEQAQSVRDLLRASGAEEVHEVRDDA